MVKIFTLTLFLAISGLADAVSAAQSCRSESKIPSTTPTERFVDHGDRTVTDSATGLMWDKCSTGYFDSDCAVGAAIRLDWQEALAVANVSTLAGHSDWRLPNFNELRSIVEERCLNPAINLSVFPNTPASYFWSSSPDADYSDDTWVVDFNNGASRNTGRSYDEYVRLVRDGK